MKESEFPIWTQIPGWIQEMNLDRAQISWWDQWGEWESDVRWLRVQWPVTTESIWEGGWRPSSSTGGGAPALMFSVTKLYDCDVCLVALPSPRRRLKGRSVESPTIEWVTLGIWGGVERSSVWRSSGAEEERDIWEAGGAKQAPEGVGFKNISVKIDHQWQISLFVYFGKTFTNVKL